MKDEAARWGVLFYAPSQDQSTELIEILIWLANDTSLLYWTTTVYDFSEPISS